MSTQYAAQAPCISIVVLTYNRREEVCATLRRLLAVSTALGGLPIVVVDNASTDGTAQRIAHEFPQVELVRAVANVGAAGRNLGVQHVHTPYVAFSDDDTSWSRTALEAAAGILDEHPDIAVINAHVLVGQQARDDPACQVMATSPLPSVKGVGPQLIGFMAGACVVRTSSFRQAGGYWAPLFIGGEETLLAWDILEQGGRIVYAPAVVTHHWPSSKRDAVQRRNLIARNDIWTAWLRLPVGMALRRSADVFRNAPTPRAKCRLLMDSLRGASTIRRYRRPLNALVCQKIEQVWQTPAPERASMGIHR